ncbi:MAG: hypothetical protein IJB35_02620, partial [Oscillospiraceae bacterium]|nr:hypothetical protein [Oscillospiraceae bacterium]
MRYEIPKYKDHSLRGYLQRQPTALLKGELARLLALEKKQTLDEYDASYKLLLTEALQLRGESTDIDLSS